jgi:hypothetical protein
MSDVIEFPGSRERDWRIWEETIRKSYLGTQFDEAVVEGALVVLKEHWKGIFEAVSFQAPSTEIPGPLTAAQMAAIRQVGEASAGVVIERLRLERTKSMGLLVKAEVMLAYFRRHGVPG